MSKRLAFLFLLLFPLSTGYYYDISSDGEHLIFLDSSKIVIEGVSEFNVSNVFSVAGDGERIYAASYDSIYVYDYHGNLIEERPTEFYVFSITYGDRLYAYGYSGGNRTIYDLDSNRALYNVSYDLFDIAAYGNRLFAVAEENSSYFVLELPNKRLMNLTSIAFLAVLGEELYILDENGMKIGSISLSHKLSEPKPIRALSASEAAIASSSLLAGRTSLIYYIRQRRLSSLLSFRKLLSFKRDLLLSLPLAGLLLEILVMPSRDLLSVLVVIGLSIGGGYGLYSLVLRKFRERFKLLSVLLSAYSAVFSFYSLSLITRRRSVSIFYSLAFIYAVFYIPRNFA